MDLLYLEHDGRLLTVERDGRTTLPTPDEVDLPHDVYTERTLHGGTVVRFAQAELEEHPEHWARKDDLAYDDSCDPLLHHAINASLFRPVVGVVVECEGKILLVEPARGVAAGRWTLPGGFLNAFEEPTQGAKREVLEETGVVLDTVQLAESFLYSHAEAPYPILGLGFTATTDDPTLNIREEEIAQARWMHVDEVLEQASGMARAVLERMTKGDHL